MHELTTRALAACLVLMVALFAAPTAAADDPGPEECQSVEGIAPAHAICSLVVGLLQSFICIDENGPRVCNDYYCIGSTYMSMGGWATYPPGPSPGDIINFILLFIPPVRQYHGGFEVSVVWADNPTPSGPDPPRGPGYGTVYVIPTDQPGVMFC